MIELLGILMVACVAILFILVMVKDGINISITMKHEFPDPQPFEDDAYDKEGDLKEKNPTIKDVTEAIQEIMLGEDQNEGR